MNGNLPHGVTDAMVDAAFGDDDYPDPDVFGHYEACVSHDRPGWCNCETIWTRMRDGW